MATIIKTRKFCFTSAGLNSNKMWIVHLYDNGDVQCEWGRTGEGKMQSKTFSGVGESFMLKKIKEKTKPSSHYDDGCYREVETLDAPASTDIKSVKSNELKKLAVKQIASCPVTSKLIEFFTDVNAHQITEFSGGKISYSVDSGLFKTPLGVITKSNIDLARTKLDTLAKFVQTSDFSKKFVKELEDFLMLVPQSLPRKFIAKEFLGDQAAVQKQNALLDGLDSSYASVIASAQTDDGKKASHENQTEDEPKLFNVSMALLDDKAEFDRIDKLFTSTKKQMHYGVYRHKLKKVYTVSIEHMNKAFEDKGSKLDNIWELWHGGSACNILSILKSGLLISPPSTAYISGKNYGPGCYFSDQSSKSLQYATSFWGGKGGDRSFMFFNKIAMGNYLVPKSTTSSRPPAGYDSYFAKGGISGVQNNEMVVFKEYQIKPIYLCEFSEN